MDSDRSDDDFLVEEASTSTTNRKKPTVKNDRPGVVPKLPLKPSGITYPDGIIEYWKTIQYKDKTGLCHHLMTCPDGKTLLASYMQNNNTLLPSLQDTLANIVIDRERDTALQSVKVGEVLETFQVPAERLTDLANDIHLIFQTERADIYYKPGKYVNKEKKHRATGKLRNTYRYKKGQMQKAGILAKSESIDSSGATNATASDVSAEKALTWLEANIEPEALVSEYWRLTHAQRRLELSDQDFTLDAYFNKYPCTKLQLAVELFGIDFQMQYPGHLFSIEDDWPALRAKIILMLQTYKKPNNPDDIAYLQLLSIINKEKHDALVLHLLCGAIKSSAKKVDESSVSRRGRRRQDKSETHEAVESEGTSKLGKNKTSAQERRQSFFLHVENSVDIDIKIDEHINYLKSKKETLQPLPVFVGPLPNIHSSYVFFNDVKYEVNSPIQAITTAFHMFFALDCEYPRSSYSLWIFVQKFLFGIDLPNDEVSISLNSVIGFLEK